MKALLLRAVVLARRHRGLAVSTRRQYRRRLDHALDAAMALAPTATYRKVTGGFRCSWGADLDAGIRSIISTAQRRGIDAYQVIVAIPRGGTILELGSAATTFLRARRRAKLDQHAVQVANRHRRMPDARNRYCRPTLRQAASMPRPACLAPMFEADCG